MSKVTSLKTRLWRSEVSGELVSSYWMKSNITKLANILVDDLFYEQPPSLSNQYFMFIYLYISVQQWRGTQTKTRRNVQHYLHQCCLKITFWKKELKSFIVVISKDEDIVNDNDVWDVIIIVGCLFDFSIIQSLTH